jgi:predicted DNA-binding transcriptional regulator YafY
VAVAARKSERLLNLIVMLLETSRPVTAKQIHETIPGYGQAEWDTFKRMFERDKQELREMGIPLELSPVDSWELEQGYRIPKDRYYLPDLELEPDELAALWLAAGLVRVSDPGRARSALMKLSDENLPKQDNLSWLTADLGLSAPNLPLALECVAERKKVSFNYQGSTTARSRTMQPYGLAHRRGHWYLVGHDLGSHQTRSFRLDRIDGAIRPTEPSRAGPEFEVPQDFDPGASLEAPPFAKGEAALKAEIRFEPSTAWLVERTSPWLVLDFSEDSSATTTVEVADVDGFLSWVLGFGDGAELLGPPELRQEILERLEVLCG